MTQTPARRSRKRLFLIVIGLLVLALILYYFLHGRSSGGAAPKGGPGMMPAAVTVAVGQAGSADVPVLLQALGTVIANNTVTVTSRVDGELQTVYFTEGQYVEKGQVLAQIDPRAYQATLAQYQGALAENQALLTSAQLTLQRYQRLYAKDSLAKQDLDTQAATVGQYAGAVKSDQAQIDAAKLNIQYARITSPINGYVGLRLVDPGNIVQSSSTTGIVTVTQTNPIAVTFSIPQAQLRSVLPKVRQGQQLPVQALDQLDATDLASGTLKFISNEIDTSTGSIKLKALFANPDEKLYPNQFVNVKLQTDTLKGAVVVPSAAVQLSSDGNFVYRLKADNSVERVAVTTGPVFGEQTVLTQGVAKGDRVVTRGIDHLRDGLKVSVEGDAQKAPQASGGSQQP
ncbi:MAG: efflux RND transporter periplasmic adaptor subunit [Pseudomonas sp.]|uniref:efflux RND transporter periplasmic adaptor subunit n=1 Tax=Pseudomonas abieticivorans TaxID=2931382 RepID=UPI0020BED1E9|nr:efflux RND transporter periplasmic adaptor subunit [Pseudomonas sp. PIA16]MDE1168897.1 efflux RND transporter periplasmic adaptor subunit [Pseudomonas sp.]